MSICTLAQKHNGRSLPCYTPLPFSLFLTCRCGNNATNSTQHPTTLLAAVNPSDSLNTIITTALHHCSPTAAAHHPPDQELHDPHCQGWTCWLRGGLSHAGVLRGQQ